MRLSPAHYLILGLALAGAWLVGCSQTDPYVRPGLWRPLGANATNLELMIANPADLQAGHGASGSPGDLAATAVARLRADAVKPLPASSVSTVKLVDPGPAPAAAPGGAPGGAAAAP